MITLSKKRVAWLSVMSNALLTAGKAVAGVMTGSVSILSEAAHSAMDLVAAMIATFSVHVSDHPPDSDHPYGHHKVENVSGVIEGLLIFAAAGYIIYESVDKLIHGVELRHLGPGALVMAASAGVNLVVSTLLRRTAKATRSVALEADATHLLTDVYTSAGVFAGLAAIALGERFWPGVNLSVIDPLIALLVAALILSAAWRITRKSFLPLMDVAASREELACIDGVLAEFRGRGVDFHKLRTRRAGPALHLDLHMGCRPGVTLEHGHGVSHELKARLEQCLPGSSVLIHVEPSPRSEVLSDSDFEVGCIRDELLKDGRVREIKSLKVTRYDGSLRVETDLGLDPEVNLAESHVLSHDLERAVSFCVADVTETVIGLHPAQGWTEAIHEDDRERIERVLGDRKAYFAGIHELEVTSSGGRHRVRLRIGMPPLLPVAEAHAIAARLKDAIQELFPRGAEIDMAIEPCDEKCEWCQAAVCPVKK